MNKIIETSKIYFLVFALISYSCSTNDEGSTIKEDEIVDLNQAPGDFLLQEVENNAINVSPKPIFSWEESKDPEGNSIRYNLLLDTLNPPEKIYAENLSSTSFTISNSLDLSKSYFWRVEAIDDKDATTKSAISNFFTLDFQIPLMSTIENADFPVRNGHGSVVFNDKIWVIGGGIGSYRKDVWSSSDGLNWELVTDEPGFSARTGFTLTVFKNKMWLIGGFAGFNTNDVWFTEDGINWTEATPNASFSKRTDHTSVVFDNKLWVIGGTANSIGIGAEFVNDIWYTEDGLEWTMATENADFEQRSGHASLVFDEKMWVIAGYLDSSGSDIGDAWYSTDGILWEKATTDSDMFSGRVSHFSTVFDDKMWVFGGFKYSGSGYRNDIWYSTDGIKWFEATPDAPFSKRANSSGVVFDNKIWLIAGGRHLNTSGTENTNDIWVFSKKTN